MARKRFPFQSPIYDSDFIPDYQSVPELHPTWPVASGNTIVDSSENPIDPNMSFETTRLKSALQTGVFLGKEGSLYNDMIDDVDVSVSMIGKD